MSAIELPALETFEQYVRDCLSHLYDYSFLRDHVLVSLLVPEQAGAAQVQTFRQIVTESIEHLRPDSGATFHSKGARIYNILMLRYIDQQQPQEVMQQLALSERQFYRDHPKAIQTLSQLLWERLTGIQPTSLQTPTTESPAAISLESEVQRVHKGDETGEVDLITLLEGAITATNSMAQQHRVYVSLLPEGSMPLQGIPGSVLRQAILLLMSQLIIQLKDGGDLDINVEMIERGCRIAFLLNGKIDPAALQETLAGNKSLSVLLETIESTLGCDPIGTEEISVTLDIPLNQRTVLLVDDNPGMLDLFQRYLAGQPYHVMIAPEGESAIQIARQNRPAVIILDVMLPGKDGWEVLQVLKNHPSTRHIPVLVCSVLEAADLAYSLGADAYIQKPPSQNDFLKLLSQWQG